MKSHRLLSGVFPLYICLIVFLVPEGNADIISEEHVGPPMPPPRLADDPKQLKSLLFQKEPVFEEILNPREKSVLDIADRIFQLKYTSLPVKAVDLDDSGSEEALEVRAFELLSGIVARAVREVLMCLIDLYKRDSPFILPLESEGSCGGLSTAKLEFLDTRPLNSKLLIYNTKRPGVNRELPAGASINTLQLWEPTRPTKILLVFLPYEFLRKKNHESMITQRIIKAYTKKYGKTNSHNIIEVRWPEIRRRRRTLLQLAAKLFKTGMQLAQIIANWVLRGDLKLELTHIIGVSLGAHLAGFIGSKVKALTGGKAIGRITGLDPLGWGFDELDGSSLDSLAALTSDDATFVDVIHTSAPDSVFPFFHYGTNENRGKVDFYPNNGRAQYCSPTDGLCHHLYSTQLFIQSISAPRFHACKCESWEQFINKMCFPCPKTAKMGENVEKSSDGVFFLVTA